MAAAVSGTVGSTRFGRGGRRVGAAGLWRAALVCLLALIRMAVPRKLLVAVLAAGMILAPLPAAFAHDRIEAPAHAAAAAQEAAEHGHDHDDGDTAGHAHGGHDPADHSHQFAFLATAACSVMTPFPQRWPSLWNGTPDPASGLGIDRPPKRTTPT